MSVTTTHDAAVTADSDALFENLRAMDADQLREYAANLIHEHQQFRKLVRRQARIVKRDQGWCEDGFNRTMRALGLPEYNANTGQLTTTVTLDLTINGMSHLAPADRERIAREWIAGSMRSTDQDVRITTPRENGQLPDSAIGEFTTMTGPTWPDGTPVDDD